MLQVNLDSIRKSIVSQGKAVQMLSDNLGEESKELVEWLYSLKGKAVICGMGKSGHIARKIAATMSSTGTPAIYVHPAESLHGDLGMITKDDLAILISKSGENAELNLMSPALKKIGVKIVAVTCNTDSSLAKLANLVVDLGDVDEICPLSLAPTTTATLSLVYLDAIAMEVMRLKNFQPEDYALFHPGGRLGRRLLFSVADLMVPIEKAPVISLNEQPKQMLHAMTTGQMGAVLVVSENNELLGLITDNDVRKTLENDLAFFSLKIESIMNRAPSTCTEQENAYEVLLKMRKREKPITLMPVLNKNGLLAGLLRLETMVQQGLV